MQWLYRVIGQAGIFLICAQTVVHFRPKESYDKYLKLLLSVMLLLQLLQPVFTAFGSGDYGTAEEQAGEFTAELQNVLTLAGERAQAAEEEIQHTADAVVAGQSENGATQETVESSEEETEQSAEIRVEVGPIGVEQKQR